MAVASFPVGNRAVADTQAAVMLQTAVDAVESRRGRLRLGWPLLRFWDVYTPEGWKYYVDFAHPDAAGANPDTVAFDGIDYQTIKLAQAPIVQSLDGMSLQMQLTVLDPYHTVLGFLRDHDGLRNQKVRLRVIWYDMLSTPELADPYEWYIQSALARQGPDSVTLVLGTPNLFEISPRALFWNRRRCHNAYQNRFDPKNHCRYPSDEFSGATKQFFDGSVDTEVEKLHGWYTLMASKADLWFSDAEYTGGVDRAMRVDITTAGTTDVRWLNANRNGPFAYKKISGDFDCYTKVHDNLSNRNEFLFGLLCQSVSDPSDWLFWGWHEDTGAVKYLERKTVNDVSTDTARGTNPPFHTSFRMQRAGTTFKLYSRYEDITEYYDTVPSESDWTEQTSGGFTLDLGTDVRIGLLTASDEQLGTSIYSLFFYLRFLSGGLSECDRSLADCVLHANSYQFNGFLGMPDNLRF